MFDFSYYHYYSSLYYKYTTFKKQFTQREISDINKGIKPANFRIHHHQNTGEIQLVHKNSHDKTGHTDGKTIWSSFIIWDCFALVPVKKVNGLF
ncbi:hypothetical protein HLK66_11070 [Niallia circulans]|uniref:HNH endonuclease n=1 Tax=Niallia circulans TaxID=1397 RepID=UPI0002EAADD9|nr:HNH endonuclease [Niallia circulans]QJX62139.1 hypothetical protein HLK66_11070 [Niallia circulans]